MKKVGFFLKPSVAWMGGVNYYKNLFRALSLLPQNEYAYLLFLPEEAKKFEFEQVFPGEIIYDSRLFDFYEILLPVFIALHEIDIISHSKVLEPIDGCKIITWIPDFQHLHLPQFFTKDEIEGRNILFETYSEISDAIITSSQHAYRDFTTCFNRQNNVKVLNFSTYIDLDTIEKNYFRQMGKQKYFFLPNQFWQHKNHLTVFKAIKKAKEHCPEIKLICSGWMEDYRNSDYQQTLLDYIEVNDLGNNIELIGLIEIEQVYQLIIGSVAVINASLFEGWSTTVEECKVLDHLMILSDIEVHREQNPKAFYFPPLNYEALSERMLEIWNHNIMEQKEVDFVTLKSVLLERMKVFAQNYQMILNEVFTDDQTDSLSMTLARKKHISDGIQKFSDYTSVKLCELHETYASLNEIKKICVSDCLLTEIQNTVVMDDHFKRWFLIKEQQRFLTRLNRLIEWCAQQQKIIVYGAGTQLEGVYPLIEKQIVLIIDGKIGEGEVKDFFAHKIYPVSKLKEFNEIPILVTPLSYRDEIISTVTTISPMAKIVFLTDIILECRS